MKRNSYIEGLYYELPHTFREISDRMTNDFTEKAYVSAGVVRWLSNDRVPPMDILEFWKLIGKSFDLELSSQVREKENAEYLEAYKQRIMNVEPNQEELFEMRAAFGNGTTVIDVITKKEIKL